MTAAGVPRPFHRIVAVLADLDSEAGGAMLPCRLSRSGLAPCSAWKSWIFGDCPPGSPLAIPGRGRASAAVAAAMTVMRNQGLVSTRSSCVDLAVVGHATCGSHVVRKK